MNYDETMTLLKDIQTDTKNKMRDLEEYILHQQELLDEKTEEIENIKKQIKLKILDITDQIHDFQNSKEYKEFLEDGSCILILDSEDTQKLDAGTYYYDVQVSLADGRVDTIIGPCKLVINKGVTERY